MRKRMFLALVSGVLLPVSSGCGDSGSITQDILFDNNAFKVVEVSATVNLEGDTVYDESFTLPDGEFEGISIEGTKGQQFDLRVMANDSKKSSQIDIRPEEPVVVGVGSNEIDIAREVEE